MMTLNDLFWHRCGAGELPATRAELDYLSDEEDTEPLCVSRTAETGLRAVRRVVYSERGDPFQGEGHDRRFKLVIALVPESEWASCRYCQPA